MDKVIHYTTDSVQYSHKTEGESLKNICWTPENEETEKWNYK